MVTMQGKQILVIDDDPQLLKAMQQTLRWAGGQVQTATDGIEGLRQLEANPPDLIILDIMMPELDGWETCRRIRQISQVPILMLTALEEDNDIIQGLNTGADDYLVKPFTADVLVARVLALLRRAALPTAARQPTRYKDDYLAVDLVERQVLVQGQRIDLTPMEYRLLIYLIQNPNRVLSPQHILANVWGIEDAHKLDEVHTCISNLRQKLEKDAEHPQYLLTQHEIGYRFRRLPPVQHPESQDTPLITENSS